MKDVFGMENFNLIQDDNNYYFFRALNSGDESDFEKGITCDNDKIIKIRTDRQRWEERKGSARYSEYSKVSLEEVWDHIRQNHSYETNCISLTSNSNVVLDYGKGKEHNGKYVMVKVPKNEIDKEQIFSAGKYLLKELEEIIDNKIENFEENSMEKDLINQVDNATNLEEVNSCIVKRYNEMTAKSGNSKYTSKDKIEKKDEILSRFKKKDIFSEEQQLEYNKIIAKLTILESKGILKKVINRCSDNKSLIATIGMAFSSSELIHYKEMEQNEFIEISEEYMNLMSLVQQIDTKEIDKNQVLELQKSILDNLYKGTVITSSSNYKENNDKIIDIEEAYNLTDGRTNYQKARQAMDFYNKLCISRKEAIENAKILENLNGKSNDAIEYIKRQGFVINNSIVTRRASIDSYKLSEQLGLAINRTEQALFSLNEQKKIIDMVLKLDEQSLEKNIENHGINAGKNMLETFLEKKEPVDKNRYYAEYIIDSIDLSKIYKKNSDEISLTEQERELLIVKLQNVDCKKLYDAFNNIGINHNDMSTYIVSLMASNGYKGYDFEEFTKIENLEDVLNTNIKNAYLKNRITLNAFETLLGRQDNKNIVEGTDIELRDYQEDAVNNINEIYNEKKFAGVILPTGAGKSFVAMSEMMKFKGKNILYVAPNVEILSQVKRHIIKNILGIEIVKDSDEITDDNLGKRKMYFKDAEKEIENVLKIKMMCYQGLDSKERESLKNYDADLIILDELHRSGAKTWEPQVKALLDENKNAKILGITATPERDVDGKNMMNVIAEMSGDFTAEEILEKKHLASEMYLLDAIRDNIVVSPQIVSFNYELENTEEFKEMERLYQEAALGSKERAELENAYKRMKEIIEVSKLKGMKGIIEENITKKDGRYIVFLPHTPSDFEGTKEEFVLSQIEEVKKQFAGIDEEPEVHYLLSDRKEKSKNITAINEFETSKSSHLKLIFAIDMLNEGVHVDGIDGCVMLRPIGDCSKILYLQQIGRCIYSIDPENPPKDVPVIFDVYNNYLIHNLNKDIKKGNITSDLQRLQAVVNWSEKHKNYFPDINSEEIDEARRAITLKNIKEKYQKYIDGVTNKNITSEERYQIEKILEVGSRIELWDTEIPERTEPPLEEEIDNTKAFEISGEIKEFFDIFKENTKKREIKVSKSLLLRRIIETLEILTENGIEISNDTINKNTNFKNIYDRLSAKAKDELSIWSTDENFDIYEKYQEVKQAFYYRKSTDKIFTQYDLKDLRRYGILEKFISPETSKELSSIDNRNFVIHGPNDFKYKNALTGSFYDENGMKFEDYIEHSEERIWRNSKSRGTENKLQFKLLKLLAENNINVKEVNNDNFAEILNSLPKELVIKLEKKGINENYDFDGYYNKVRRDFAHSVNLMIEIVSGMNIEELNSLGMFEDYFETNGSRKVNSMVNKEGFIIMSRFSGYNIYTGNRYDKEGYDYYGYDEHDFDKRGYNKNTYEYIDKHGFDKDGYWYYLENGKYVNSNKKINNHGFNIDGYYCELQEDGSYIVTESKVHNNFDIDGFSYSKDINGKYRCTYEIYDEDGYDIDGLDKYKFDRNGINGITNKIINSNGFNQKGYYCYEDENGNIIQTDVKYNNYYFDIDGMYYELDKDGNRIKTDRKEDERGFDGNGLYHHKREYDANKFDRDGFLYEIIDGVYQKTEKKINEYGFDCNGYFYEKQKDGSYVNTGEKANERGFGIDKYHYSKKYERYSLYDDEGYDFYGLDKNLFDKNKIHSKTKTEYNERGFKADGLCYYKKGGIISDVGSKLDSHNFDIEGYYHNNSPYQYKGERREIDPRGFKTNGINQYTRNNC